MLSTFIKLPFDIKIFVLSIFEWPFYTDFTAMQSILQGNNQIKINETNEIVLQSKTFRAKSNPKLSDISFIKRKALLNFNFLIS